MDLSEVTEGGTRLRVPRHGTTGARGAAKAGPAFYNPAMALTRDITVLAARATRPPRDAEFLDGLAGAGARGLRVAHEAPGWAVTLNDADPGAVAVARENAKRLGLAVDVLQGDLNALLAGSGWWAIEVDPYGSPVPFLSLAMRSVRPGGLLGVSATDTTALHGTRPQACRRRYLAEPPPRRAPGWKAAAARLLVGYVMRTAAQFDRVATPLFVHEHRHALRALVRIDRGAQRADEALGAVRPMVLCAQCQTWGRERCACGQGRPSGPYFLGALHDLALVAAMQATACDGALAEPRAVDRLLTLATEEARLGPFYLDIDEACRHLKVPPPRTEALLAGLREAGIHASPTHYGPKTLAHDAGPAEVLEVVRALSGRRGSARP